MFVLNGKYNSATVYTDMVDDKGISQIIWLLNQEFAADSRICMMPDTHAGAGCVIGTTMTIKDKVCPNLVGVDIGCGMEVVILEEKEIDLPALDAFIRSNIPAGFAKREKTHPLISTTHLAEMEYREISESVAGLYLGTLGGGNHFIEVDRFDDGRLCLVIHSGSRAVGRKVAEHYQKAAYDQMRGVDPRSIDAYVAELKTSGRSKEIPKLLKERWDTPAPGIQKDLAYLTGYLLEAYLHDMEIVQDYAAKNRQIIINEIIKGLGLHQVDRFTTIHNYVDTESGILRKGAVSAKAYEKFIVPLNMRDGALICRGKGNPDWNFSAPHGAGRLYSRSAAKENFSLEEYQEAMKGIFTTSVSLGTLDESPMAYKDAATILENIQPTAEVLEVIRPVYNFKAGKVNS